MTSIHAPLAPVDLAHDLAQMPLVAVLRATTATHFLPAAQVLHAEGIDCVEFTLTSAGALEAIGRARRELPRVIVGAGTVRTPVQARAAIEAGAQFLVSQTYDAEVLRMARGEGLPYVPGALTPTEIVHAWRAGAPMVKVSPVGPLGGVGYLRELVGPMPDIALMPTGGIGVDDVGDYLNAGAALVGVSRDLYRDCLESGNLVGLRQRAGHAVEAVLRR